MQRAGRASRSSSPDQTPSDRPLRVLLFGPDPERDPLSGDITYVQSLIHCPPPGVEYVPYARALADGTVVRRGRRPRHGRPGPTDLGVAAVRSLEHLLRRSRLTYREPTWFVTIEPGVYDLVHQHLFALRQIGPRTPVVSTSGAPLGSVYASRDGWSRLHVAVADAIQLRWARSLDVDDPHCRHGDDELMAVYTERFRDWLIDRGGRPQSIRVVSTAVGDTDRQACGSERRLGFIGREFDRKGGPTVLDVYERLRVDDPALRLTVVTEAPCPTRYRGRDDVEWIRSPDRRRVVDEVIPRLGVLVLPTRADCGVPYAVLESLRAGVPAVITRTEWLDTSLEPPAVVLCDHDPAAIGAAIVGTLSGDLPAARAAARALWDERHRIERLGAELAALYRDRLERIWSTAGLWSDDPVDLSGESLGSVVATEEFGTADGQSIT